MILESVKTLCPDPSVIGLGVYDHGWNSNKPEFAEIVQAKEHKLIVEVGSWFGQSALNFCKLVPGSIIICVDTWLGSTEALHFKLPKNHGYPDCYRQFLANVAYSPYADRVFPLVQTSRNAARMLTKLPFRPTLVYVDGSHMAPDVYDDMSDYWKLVAPGGTMFGDDLDNPHHPDVRPEVERFCKDYGLTFEVKNGFWVIQKP